MNLSSYFTILGTRTANLGGSYSLAVNGFGDKKQKINLSLKSDDEVIESKDVEINGNESRLIEFYVSLLFACD
jgi:hypothetical protein